MNEKKPPTDEDQNDSNLDTQEMVTLFSSDNTELTDFTQRIKQAMRRHASELQDDEAAKREAKPASFKDNVVNLFKPK